MQNAQGLTTDQVIDRMAALDAKSGTLPVLVHQVSIVRDKQFWSTTHSWPWVRSKMMEFGIVREAKDREHAESWQPVTEFTDFGREVRAALLERV